MTSTTTTASGSRFASLVEGIRVAMVTTVAPDGSLHGRPLTVQRTDEDGTVWFLVDAQAEWLTEQLGPVSVGFTDSDTWVAASGTASLVTDQALLSDLGDPVSDAWFEEGSHPAALRVDVNRADYWDGPGTLVQLVQLGKAAVTGDQPDMGERGVLEP
jgi:general stress protein 26